MRVTNVFNKYNCVAAKCDKHIIYLYNYIFINLMYVCLQIKFISSQRHRY